MDKTVVKTYKGSQEQATKEYQKDAVRMAHQGYTPTSQVWTPGSYGCGTFILALLLCVLIIGILIFIYMVIVKPPGALTVTYTLAPRPDPEKACPKCAETVKAAATVCRFCGHTFEQTPVRPFAISETAASAPKREVSGAEALGRKLGGLFSKKPPGK